MKRSTSSINNNRDVSSYQSKRIRPNTLARLEENVTDRVNNNSISFQSQKKVIKVKSQNLQEKISTDEISHDNNNSIITASTPSGSTVSFSSSLSSKARPTAEVVEWIQELLDLMNNKTSFQGDGRILDTIVDDLGLDEVSFITVAARTPQESALKLFHLLYPTVISRANCGSISRVHQAQLNNIYMCVRHIHKNLSFSKNEMRKAIGTLIRSAKRELRRAQGTRQQLNVLQNDENLDPDENDENTNATSDMKAILDTTNDITDDDDEEKKDEDHNEDDDEYENKDEGEGEDEDEDEDGNFDKVNNLMIDEALDEDNEDDN
ncbi:unnamed protein product [Rotaria sordida]|uniref:Uncharacterized protein n=1 Tax=Rotaria sordida TaxID=392033 RepID=A0A815I1Q9_9BILA|nr:unnamed protein product [Rotaria sordida]CAF1379392.1 unnamed protein product [Rotaria sordida]